MTTSKFTAENVSSFNGYSVTDGEVDISTAQFIDMLDETNEEVTICGMTYSAGQALEAVDPVAFRCALSDYESVIQSDLEYQLDNEDASGIEFLDEFDGEE